MKLFFTICFFALLILNSQPGFSQKEVEISGVKYLLHTVKKGETAFSLCQKYNVNQTVLNEANPGLTAVMKAGSTIKIPIRKDITEKKPEPTVVKAVVAEPEYYYHKVNKKQTIFSIARQYGITANELIRYNPEISNGLVTGRVIKIPIQANDTAVSTDQPDTKVKNVKSTASDIQTEDGFIYHTVVAGETVYSLEQKYVVSREELIILNPILEKGLKTGTKLKIPLRKIEPTPIEDVQRSGRNDVAETTTNNGSGNCIPIVGQNARKYNIALLLPLYLHGNDQNHSAMLSKGELLSHIDINNSISKMPIVIADSVAVHALANIDQRAVSFLEFYEGVLLAIDSLQRNGMNIELYVFDVTNQEMINNLLQLDVFRELDLIIGPVYPELQESVASFAAKNRIPMVSPLAATGNFEESNPYYFKVNPTKEYQIEQTANYIAKEFQNKNFILLPMTGGSNSAEAKLAELGKEKLLSARQLAKNKKDIYHEYSFPKQGLSSVKSILDEDSENVFIIPTDNEAQVSVAVTNLNALAEHYDVVLIGTSNLTKLKSIQTENYHHTRLRYLSPTFIDYNKPLVRRFVSEYRATYSTEPSQFSHQGYDVSFYFLSALYRYGKDFRSCLPDYKMEMTQMDFSFERVTTMGGYMNRSLFITAWERNYDVLNYGVMGGNQP